MHSKCQKFTPEKIIKELLDSIGYTKDICGKKIIENSCGDGRILVEVIDRYINYCLNLNLDLDEIKKGLENDIYGAEIDETYHDICIKNLDEKALKYNIRNVKWNIYNGDILKCKDNFFFDFVVGNPPYIIYRDLKKEDRDFVRENFQSCSQGQFDYCYAFIEFGLKSLNHNGKLSYIIPNSIFKNKFAKLLRDMILPYLEKIIDYTTLNLFDDALTSSAIIKLNRSSKENFISYIDVVNKKHKMVSKDKLNEKWVFTTKESMKNEHKFQEYFKVSNSIATLYNKAFIINDFTECDGYIIKDNIKIEKEVLRKAYSARNKRYEKQEYIIFPYYYNENGDLKKYDENTFYTNFPGACEYLKKFSDKLGERNSDQSAKWYEYGRSQALLHLNCKKLLLSTIVTNQVNVYEIDELGIPYSGFYIIQKGDKPLSYAKEILESKEFLSYVKGIGINANGNSLRISATDINNYKIL